MATIFRRIKHLRIKPLPTQETRLKIGKEVAEAYFSQQNKPRIFKIKSQEPEGEFMALSYPKKFHDTIDKIILKHCRPKRPRISNRVGGSKP